MRLSLLLLLLPWAAPAQELPPPGGWPLRPVTELRAVPEPSGGLVPYRHGTLWGFADTTGRVWIRPVFANEPDGRFGAGLLLWAEREPVPGDGRRPNQEWQPKLVDRWNLRYGVLYNEEDYGPLTWALSFRKTPNSGAAFLLNAHGEQLLATARQAIVSTANGGWRTVERTSAAGGQRELVAIEGSEVEPAWKRPGRVFTTPLTPQLPAVPTKLLEDSSYHLDPTFSTPFFGSIPLYLAQQVNKLHPTEMVTHTKDGLSRQVEETRYQHDGSFALFDAQGRRLTEFRYAGMKPLLAGHLAYWQWNADDYEDEAAAEASGLPSGYILGEDLNGPSRRYGLLDRRGHEITPPRYVRMEAAGPNSVWVVAVREQRLHYGLIDTLGRYLLPLVPQPLSLPDAAGLLRRRSSPPLAKRENDSFLTMSVARFPDKTTLQYLRPDGRPAFAGRFAKADSFWQGRALVQLPDGRYGLLDSLGHWVLPPQPDELSYYAYSEAHHRQRKLTDPLLLFDYLDGESGHRGGGWYGSTPVNPLLLLAYNVRGYGLRDGRSGRVVVPAEFDQRPYPWYGGVVGKRRGQPLGYSYTGQPFNPDAPASYPPGVRQPTPADSEYRPLLQQTQQGWRTRGGRQLWQD